MAGRGLPWEVPAVQGLSWTSLSASQELRTNGIARRYKKSVLILTGGTSDLSPLEVGGDNNSGTQALEDMGAYAVSARAAGFDKIIALTVTPSTWFDADFEVQREILNEGIKYSTYWDHVVDVAANSDLSDPTNVAYYYDQLHWTPAGNHIVAAMVSPILDEVLATL